MKLEEELPVIKTRDIKLRGVHNLENIMAAVVTSRLAGASLPAIRQTARDFRGLEHRLEEVRTINRVLFVNDSKATTVAATVKAVQSYSRPIVLILGGRDKGEISPPASRAKKQGQKDPADWRSQRENKESSGRGLPAGRSQHLPGAGGQSLPVSPAGRRGAAGAGLHLLGHVPELRGTGPAVQERSQLPGQKNCQEEEELMEVFKRFAFDKVLLVNTLLLLILGIIMVFRLLGHPGR